MIHSFIWTDLSTFDTDAAKRFYRGCFFWHYGDLGDSYLICHADGHPSAGLYLMPERFQRMKMPSFWMPYIHVMDLNQTVQIAEQNGGKIEVRPEPAPGGGRIALVRDPAGAGFTCYEGDDPGGRDGSAIAGRLAWVELHVSDLSKVREFYQRAFGWEIRPAAASGRYEIFRSGQVIAGIQVTSNDIKGTKEYWGVYFAVDDLQSAVERVERGGGQIVAEQPVGSRPAVLAYDPFGAAFHVIETSSLRSSATVKSATVKWRAISGLLLIAFAILLEANWLWGVLFLLWVVPDLKSGSTHFLEHVERRRNPVVYWLIIVTWTSLSLYLLFG